MPKLHVITLLKMLKVRNNLWESKSKATNVAGYQKQNAKSKLQKRKKHKGKTSERKKEKECRACLQQAEIRVGTGRGSRTPRAAGGESEGQGRPLNRLADLEGLALRGRSAKSRGVRWKVESENWHWGFFQIFLVIWISWKFQDHRFSPNSNGAFCQVL